MILRFYYSALDGAQRFWIVGWSGMLKSRYIFSRLPFLSTNGAKVVLSWIKDWIILRCSEEQRKRFILGPAKAPLNPLLILHRCCRRSRGGLSDEIAGFIGKRTRRSGLETITFGYRRRTGKVSPRVSFPHYLTCLCAVPPNLWNFGSDS